MSTRHSIIGLNETLKWMESKGYSRSDLLAHTEIDEARLLDPKGTLVPTEELSFYRNLLRLSGNPHILLEAGFNLNIATYGIWGLALISSPTFEKAIALGLQFIDFTYTYNRIIYFEDERHAGIRISHLTELGALQRPMIERDVSAVFVLFQLLLQEERPVEEICFTWEIDRELAYFENLFHCTVRFNAGATEVRFAKSCLQYELPQHNVLAMELCREQLEQIRPQLIVEQGAVERVQQYLLITPLYRASMEDCASSMAMSSRTLRRQLGNSGTSYQTLLDEFRRLLADKYLDDTQMSLVKIAERLGYSDAANFSHAYKRWTGCAPRKSLPKGLTRV
jgi:AraC-like DNA-binding protein